MLKVLVVIPYHLNRYTHGNAIRIKQMVRILKENGVEVRLLTYDLPWIRNGDHYSYSVKMEIILAAVFSRILFNLPIFDLACATLSPIRLFKKKLMKIVEDEAIDIVQVENLWPLPPILDSIGGALPIIVTLHDVYSDRYSELIEYTSRCPKVLSNRLVKIVNRIELEYLNKVNIAVCLTEADRARYANMGVEEDKLKVIPGAVDVEKIKPQKPNPILRRKHGLRREDLILFFVGSMMYQNKKAIDDMARYILPKLLKRSSNIKLLIAGSISKYAEKRGYSKNLPIIPLGYVEDLNQYYAIADIVVIPTLLGTGFKTKTLEAMAAGKPVVCTRKAVRGMGVLNWKNIVVCEDFREMIDAILFLRERREMIERIGKNARITAEKYDLCQVFKEYLTLYENLKA
ncbi:MAG: hypothetical protein DRJ44_06980 [Thermoprotei archaeon]|nr:MAG: hypothetical protein DRJ44_06980 [Thermoprotei archaeon]